VQRLAHDAVDQVRRAEMRAADTVDEKWDTKPLPWALQKNRWNLSQLEHEKLAQLQRTNRRTRTYRAYLLARGGRRLPRGRARFTSPPPSSASG
jgi:hypothetical protein